MTDNTTEAANGIDTRLIMIFGKGVLTVGYQVRFPRSKRKRIRNKWSKRKENWSHFVAPMVVRNFRIGLSTPSTSQAREGDCVPFMGWPGVESYVVAGDERCKKVIEI